MESRQPSEKKKSERPSSDWTEFDLYQGVHMSAGGGTSAGYYPATAAATASGLSHPASPAQSHLLPYYHALPHSASQTSHASFSEPRSSAMTSSLNQQSTRSIETTFPQTSQRSTAQSSDSYSSSFNPPSSSNQQWPVSVPYFTLPPVPTSSSSASPTSSQSSSHSTPAVPSTRQPFSSWAEYYPPPPQALPPIREYLSSLSTSLSDQRPGSSSSASYGHPPAWPSPGLPAAGRSSPYTQTTSAGDETAVASTSATAAQSPGPPDTSPSAKERQRVIVACLACRGRKIRCDGVKPQCTNCIRRTTVCEYDKAPKRRGPDRQPGARLKLNAEKKRKRGVGKDGDEHEDEPEQEHGQGPGERRRKKGEGGRYSAGHFTFVAPLTGPVTSGRHNRLKAAVRAQQQPVAPPSDDDPAHDKDSTAAAVVASESLPPAQSTKFKHSELGSSSQDLPSQASSTPSFPLSVPVPAASQSEQAFGTSRSSDARPANDPNYATTSDDAFGSVRNDPFSAPGLDLLAGSAFLTAGSMYHEGSSAISHLEPQEPDVIHLHSHGVRSSSSHMPNVPYHTNSLVTPLFPTSFGAPTSGLLPSDDPPPYTDEDATNNDNRRVNRPISPGPSSEFSRKTWYDALLSLYSPDRALSAQEVVKDLKFFFQVSNFFFSCINTSFFFSTFHDPIKRQDMQPSLVLAALSMATFMRSSELGLGHAGRTRALMLRDLAQSSLESSINCNFITPSLGQAALIIALFEMSAHPFHSTARCDSAILMLDSIIQLLGLLTLDATEEDSSSFLHHSVPSIPRAYIDNHSLSSTARPCACAPLNLFNNSTSSQTNTPLWGFTATWDPDWSVGERSKEEARRLVWSALHVVSGQTAYQASLGKRQLPIAVVQANNYALYFPGEVLRKSPRFMHLTQSTSMKETIWALYARSILLFNSCLYMREDASMNDGDKAVFAVQAWQESEALEDALNQHVCDAERAFIFHCRELLFNTRMFVSSEFSRFVPSPAIGNSQFSRDHAVKWLSHQESIVNQIMQGLYSVTGQHTNILARRPFFIFWFMSQISRCLTLWGHDRSLISAITLSKTLLRPVDYLTSLWPCQTQRTRYDTLRAQLITACYDAGISPPSPPDLSLKFLI